MDINTLKMSEIYSRVAQLLSLTYSGMPDQIKPAEDELKIISQDTQGFLQCLLAIIQAPESHQLLRSASATRFRHLIRESITAGKLSVETRSWLVEAIFQTLISPYTDRSSRGVLNFALNPILGEDGLGVFTNRLASLAITGLSGEGTQIQGSLLVIKSIFSSMTPQFQSADYSKILIPHLVEVGKKGLYMISSGLQSTNEPLITEGINILEDWTSSLRQILEHFEVTSTKNIKDLSEQSEIALLFSNIINFAIPDYQVQNSIINITETPITKPMNNIKVNILKSLNIIIQYLIDFKKKNIEEQGNFPLITVIGTDLPDSPFLSCALSITEPLIISILSISTHAEIEAFLARDFITELMIETLSFFHKVGYERRFYTIFSQYHRQLIVNVCFQFIRIYEKDKELFMTDPEEFAASTQDMCERQESETTKTTSAQLLETLCDAIDGALAFTAYFVQQITDMILSGKGREGIMDYNIIRDFTDFPFMSLDEETKIETSFMVLSILSFPILRRKDILNSIEDLLVNHMERLFSTTSGIIQSRICLFFYFYSDSIFIERSHHFQTCMNFLISCISPNCHKAVNIQACETFSFMMQDEEILFRFEPFIDEVIDKIIQGIENQTEKNFFEALVEMTQNFSDALARKIIPLIAGIVKKIQIETQNLVMGNKKETIILLKLWNVIRTLIMSPSIEKAQLVEFEKHLAPILSYLQIPHQITFVDDIINVVVCIMKKTKNVTDIEWEIFSKLPEIQASQDNSLQCLFKLLNLYLMYGKDHLQEFPQKLAVVLDMAGKAMFATYKGKTRESVNSEGAILYQLALYNYAGYIDHQLNQIFSNAIVRYLQGTTQSFFKVRLLGIILAGFTYNTNLACSILSQQSTDTGITYLRFVLLQIINNSTLFVHSYDKRVAVIGLCSIISLSELPNDIAESISQIFEALIVILSQKMEDKGSKEKTKAMDALIEQLFKSDEEDDFDNEIIVKGTKLLYGESGADALSKTEENEANLLLSQINTPIQIIDEYEYFRGTLATIKSKNQENVKRLFAGLSPQRREQLLEIMQSQRVQVNDLPGENTIVRKIVKAKHR
ncbi:unnamed protein product [Blepharisma stoltei]|uniref:Importin N-terminal domain-containing protein n=1 Tax=Blepharisma stoltei TaxID=1481888 RepID=A0AAU9K0Q3_9CILI|nr:unnamed protein product [Blepharisma stoltei]